MKHLRVVRGMPKNRHLQNIVGTEHITDAAEQAIAAQAEGGATLAFKNVAVAGQSNIVADAATDTLNIAAGANVTITTNASTDTITIAATDTNTDTNTFRPVTAGGNTLGASETLAFTAGSNVTISESGGAVTIASTGGSPGGSDSQIQYNNGGSFGGISGFTFTDTDGSEQFLFSDTSDTALVKIVQEGTGSAFEVHDAGSDTSILRVAPDGDVHIGFGSAGGGGYGKLLVAGVSYAYNHGAESQNASSPSYQFVGDTNTGMFRPGADNVAFATGGTERIRIGDAGQIGIGGATYGTSGQVLTSGGASGAVSWTTVSGGGSSLNQALNPRDLVYSVAPSVIDTYLLSRGVGITCVGSLSNSYSTRSNYSQPRFRAFIAPKTGDVSTFLVSVATAVSGTNFLVGIYSHTNGVPTALMGRAEMDCSSTGEVSQTSIVDASGSSATISLTQGEMYFYAWNRTNTSGNPRLHCENPAGTQSVVNQVQTMNSVDNSYNMLDVGSGSANTLPATPTANQLYLGGNTSYALRLGIKYS